MTAKTSKLAYRELKESGYMPNKQFQVYNQISFYGPQTDEELEAVFGKHAHKRRVELVAANKLKRGAPTKSPITGKIAYKWELTCQGEIPGLIDKKPTRAQLIAKIAAMELGRDSSALYDAAYAKGYEDGRLEK